MILHYNCDNFKTKRCFCLKFEYMVENTKMQNTGPSSLKILLLTEVMAKMDTKTLISHPLGRFSKFFIPGVLRNIVF